MLKARKVFSRAKQLPDCGVCVELEKDILIALARSEVEAWFGKYFIVLTCIQVGFEARKIW